jgi:ADP-heptose:LPS heptosyltransferase
MSEKITKILIIKPSALGDIVLAMPAVCALAENFPNAQIDWFVRPEFAPLLENHKHVHKIVIFNRKKLGKWWCNLDAFKEFIGLIKFLRRKSMMLFLICRADSEARFSRGSAAAKTESDLPKRRK